MKPVYGTLFINAGKCCTSMDWIIGYIKGNTVWIPHIKSKFLQNEISKCKKMIPKKEINIAYKGQLQNGTKERPDPNYQSWYLSEIINVFPELSEEELESKRLRLCKTEGITFMTYDQIS